VCLIAFPCLTLYNFFSNNYRVWDVASNAEVKKIDLPHAPGLIELSKDGTLLCVPCGKAATFYDMEKYGSFQLNDKVRPYNFEAH
jgi:hypothetical protein